MTSGITNASGITAIKGGGGAPTGAAGGVLSGTYPNPGFASNPIFTGVVDVTNAVIEGTVFDNGDSGTSKAIAWNNGNIQKVTITGAVAFTFTAPTKPGRFTLLVTQDGSGHVYSFPTIIYPGGVTPAWSTAASAKDVLTVIYDGSTYWGVGNTAFA